MNFKNFIPFAAVLVCSLGNPAQVEARTPQPVRGHCIAMNIEYSTDFRCTVTPDGGGGYIIDTHGGTHHNYYVNKQARELYYGPEGCKSVMVKSGDYLTSAVCLSSEKVWSIVYPTR